MRRLMSLVVLALFVTACRGGSSGTTPTPTPQSGVSPPSGSTTWLFAYKPATSHTCPGPVATPIDGGAVTMIVAPDGKSLSLAGLAPTTITVPTIAKDAAGNWLREDPVAIAAGAFLRISFKFVTAAHAEGEVFAFKTILADLSGATCSATWPMTLDRQ